MRRIAVLIAAIAVMMTGLTAATAGAAATVPANAAAAPLNCNHWGGTGRIVKAKYVQVKGDGAALGSAQLCEQGSYYWAYVVFYAPMTTGNWGQAYLQRFRNGQVIDQWSCDLPGPLTPPSGGNGYVKPGQTQCWTKKMYGGGSTDTFRALGYSYYGVHPNTTARDAWGITSPPAR